MPSRKKKAIVFTNVTAKTYQSRLNAGFPKVCKIFKVSAMGSLKYIREFHTSVCYCGEISMPRNVTLNETNCDWLFDLQLKVWLRETTFLTVKIMFQSFRYLYSL